MRLYLRRERPEVGCQCSCFDCRSDLGARSLNESSGFGKSPEVLSVDQLHDRTVPELEKHVCFVWIGFCGEMLVDVAGHDSVRYLQPGSEREHPEVFIGGTTIVT